MSGKSIFGLNEKIVGALAYVGVFVSGILLLIFERENKFVRFHALQSTILFGVIAISNAVFSIIPLFGWMINSVLGLVAMVSWLYLIYMAYKGHTFRVPVLGDIVWEQINK